MTDTDPDSPPPAGNAVDVRALGARTRGLRHLVWRPAGAALTGLPALCGAAPRRGWVPYPTHYARDCEACAAAAARPELEERTLHDPDTT